MKKYRIIIILMLLIAFSAFADSGISDLEPGTVLADNDLFVATDTSAGYDKYWQASVIKSYLLSQDILLAGVDLTIVFGGLYTTYAEISGGTVEGTTVGVTSPSAGTFTVGNFTTSLSSVSGALNGTIGLTTPQPGSFTTLTSTSGAFNGQVGATTPSTGAFTSGVFGSTLSVVGDLYFTGMIPSGVGTYLGTSSFRVGNIFADNTDTTTLTVGDVSNTEVQRLDGVDGDILYLGRGTQATINPTYTNSTTLVESSEGGHFLNSSTVKSITLPDMAKIPIGWEVMFTNNGTGTWTIVDHSNDSGFGFAGESTSRNGTSISMPANSSVILKCVGINAKWIVVSGIGYTI